MAMVMEMDNQAVFEARADNLLATLDRIAADLGSSSAAIDRKLEDRPAFWPDWTADRQSPGTSLAAGDPVCTVFARGPSAAAARAIVRSRAVELRRCWDVCAS